MVKGVSWTIESKTKGQKGGYFVILLDKIATGLLGNVLKGKGVIQAGKATFRVGQDF